MVEYRGMNSHAVAADKVGPVDVIDKPMDMRTIRQLLEDERTLALMLPSSRYRVQFEAMASLKTHFHPVAAVANLFIYKAASQEEMSLMAAHCPQTAEDFYLLAMAIKHQQQYTIHGEFSVSQYGGAANPAALKAFSYHLLNDAAKAGHLQAKSVLIEDTIRGEAAARMHVALKDYVIAGVSMKLPRQLTFSEELRKLGSDLLIQCRRRLCVDGQPLIGAYYELANGKDAEKLAKHLLKLAESRRQEEAKEHASRQYDAQRMRSSGANGLFGTLVEVDKKSAPALVADNVCFAPAR